MFGIQWISKSSNSDQHETGPNVTVGEINIRYHKRINSKYHSYNPDTP